jgi:prepilin-type N-terminal cleavage/methylation domain-containing protein
MTSSNVKPRQSRHRRQPPRPMVAALWATLRHPRKVRAGMTLIELLVVIAIIGLLAGLLIVGANTWRTSMKIKQTRATLSILDAIADEFNVQSEGYFSNSVTTPGEFLEAAANVGEIFKFDALRKNDGGDVIDGWGKPIRFYNPNTGAGVPTERPVFWSVGPDEVNDSGLGDFGAWDSSQAYVVGNIVSYDGDVYECTAAATGKAEAPGDEAFWELTDDIGTF